jgi:hypothetical protein
VETEDLGTEAVRVHDITAALELAEDQRERLEDAMRPVPDIPVWQERRSRLELRRELLPDAAVDAVACDHEVVFMRVDALHSGLEAQLDTGGGAMPLQQPQQLDASDGGEP